MFGLYGYIAMGVLLLGLGTTTYIYKLKYDKAEINQQVAEQQRDTMQEVNQQILAANQKDAELRAKIFTDFKQAREDADEYRLKLAKHDLKSLAEAKPDTITRLARNATERVLRDIETVVNNTTDKEMPKPTND